VCCHIYVAARKFSAAKAVFEKIPADSAQLITRLWQHKVSLLCLKEEFCIIILQAGVSPLPPHIASDLTELQAICTYLEAKEAFSAWFQHFHHKKPVSMAHMLSDL
jgi:hypothetical protein